MGASFWLAGGAKTGGGAYSLAYSLDSQTWIPIVSTQIPQTGVLGIAYNGSRWVIVGAGTHHIAYSDNGLDWTGLGTSIFNTAGRCVIWDGEKFLACGYTNNLVAYSYDGENWFGLGGQATFQMTNALSICHNDNGYLVCGNVGAYSNTALHSEDGFSWAGKGKVIADTANAGCSGTAGKLLVGGRSMTPSIHGVLGYTIDGQSFHITDETAFNTTVYGYINTVSKLFVLGGFGNAAIVSLDTGLTWDYLGDLGVGMTVGWTGCFDGKTIVIGGQGSNTIVRSLDNGETWEGLGTSIFPLYGYTIAANVMPTLVPPIGVSYDDIIDVEVDLSRNIDYEASLNQVLNTDLDLSRTLEFDGDLQRSIDLEVEL